MHIKELVYLVFIKRTVPVFDSDWLEAFVKYPTNNAP